MPVTTWIAEGQTSLLPACCPGAKPPGRSGGPPPWGGPYSGCFQSVRNVLGDPFRAKNWLLCLSARLAVAVYLIQFNW